MLYASIRKVSQWKHSGRTISRGNTINKRFGLGIISFWNGSEPQAETAGRSRSFYLSAERRSSVPGPGSNNKCSGDLIWKAKQGGVEGKSRLTRVDQRGPPSSREKGDNPRRERTKEGKRVLLGSRGVSPAFPGREGWFPDQIRVAGTCGR